MRSSLHLKMPPHLRHLPHPIRSVPLISPAYKGLCFPKISHKQNQLNYTLADVLTLRVPSQAVSGWDWALCCLLLFTVPTWHSQSLTNIWVNLCIILPWALQSLTTTLIFTFLGKYLAWHQFSPTIYHFFLGGGLVCTFFYFLFAGDTEG